jgi:hypothetical protein
MPELLIGVTVIVLVIGVKVVFWAVKFKYPVPLEGNPIRVLELFQEYPVVSVPVKITLFTNSPLQTTNELIGFKIGLGSTLISMLCEAGLHGPTGSFVVKVSVIVPV